MTRSTLTVFLRWVIAVLLVVSAVLFTTGVLLERGGETTTGHRPPSTEQTHTGETGGETGSETTPHTETEMPTTPHTETAHTERERVLGVPVDSPAAVTGAIALSLLLALAIWRRPTRRVLLATAAFAAAATILDLAEIPHQIDHSRGGLAALAALIAVLHLAAAAAAAALWTTTRHPAVGRPGTPA